MTKLYSWNVNGLRAVLGKNFMEEFEKLDADFFCLQETKLQEGQVNLELPGYYQYWNYAQKKGYSGTAILAKRQPLSVKLGMDSELHDHEGRLITLEYDRFFLVTVYTPNSQIQFSAIGVDKNGGEAALPENVTWTVADAKSGTIDANGLFTPAKNYKGDVTARLLVDGTVKGTTTVKIADITDLYFSSTSVWRSASCR